MITRTETRSDLGKLWILAEGVGFEPTRTVPRPSGFQDALTPVRPVRSNDIACRFVWSACQRVQTCLTAFCAVRSHRVPILVLAGRGLVAVSVVAACVITGAALPSTPAGLPVRPRCSAVSASSI